MAVAVFAALTVLTIVCLFMPQVLSGKEVPRVIALKDSQAEVRQLFQNAVDESPKVGEKGKREWLLTFTTWLPNEWPPTPKTIWTRYAYGLDVALDGASGVSEPVARLERGVGDPKQVTLVSMAGRLNRIGTHPVRPHGGWRYTLEDEQRVLQHALALTSEPTIDARGTIGLISYFQSWRLGSAEIAAHVAHKHKAFFAWLGRQEAATAAGAK